MLEANVDGNIHFCFVGALGAQSYLPRADAFEKGIYLLEIGGNDFSYAYKNLNMTPNQLPQSVLPNVARSIAAAVQVLSAMISISIYKLF